MPNVSPEKVRTPAGSDAYALTSDLRLMGASIRGVVPVANATERGAVVSAMAAEGRPVSATNPLVVLQADLPVGAGLRYTTDGSAFRPVVPIAGATTELSFSSSGNATLTYNLTFTPVAVTAIAVVSSAYGNAVSIMQNANAMPTSTSTGLRARLHTGAAFEGTLQVAWTAVGAMS